MTPQAGFIENRRAKSVTPSQPGDAVMDDAVIDTIIDDEGPAGLGALLTGSGSAEAANHVHAKDSPAVDPVDDFHPSDRKGRWTKGRDWPVMIWIVAVHAGALAAPFYFTWQALGVCLFLAWFTGSIGVCMGYHRHLTHGSFSTYKPLHWMLALIGGWSGEGSAIQWVANHRKHHVHSDQDDDPHSPKHGGLWSHMLWFMPNFGKDFTKSMHQRWAPDLVKDPVLRFMDKMFLPLQFVLGGALFAVGYFGWDAHMGISFLVWGMFIRLLYVLHVTWFVNSASHMWGYRNYETTDNSRNLWWVGLLAYGEGWHNNHHAFQRMAKHGHRWWEVDMTYWAICAMEKVGLAWNVVHDVPARRKVVEERGYLQPAEGGK